MAVAAWCSAAKQKATIDTQIAAIRARISGTGRRGTAQAADLTGPKRRTMSAARRKAVSCRMKAYWAARKAKAAKPKRGRRTASAKKARKRMKVFSAKRKADAAK